MNDTLPQWHTTEEKEKDMKAAKEALEADFKKLERRAELEEAKAKGTKDKSKALTPSTTETYLEKQRESDKIASDICPSFVSDPNLCIKNHDCGWCALTARCVGGTRAGPNESNECPLHDTELNPNSLLFKEIYFYNTFRGKDPYHIVRHR
eukprot:GILK01015190.1.p1 GENE.GILK01015190.1~~GILK01015190.1.p1  ORF type:complete len:151 (+),score=17.65 GILK01015190.1:73-525(+)